MKTTVVQTKEQLTVFSAIRGFNRKFDRSRRRRILDAIGLAFPLIAFLPFRDVTDVIVPWFYVVTFVIWSPGACMRFFRNTRSLTEMAYGSSQRVWVFITRFLGIAFLLAVAIFGYSLLYAGYLCIAYVCDTWLYALIGLSV